VRKTTVPDYNEWVQPADEMWLEQIRARVSKHHYATGARWGVEGFRGSALGGLGVVYLLFLCDFGGRGGRGGD